MAGHNRHIVLIVLAATLAMVSPMAARAANPIFNPLLDLVLPKKVRAARTKPGKTRVVIKDLPTTSLPADTLMPTPEVEGVISLDDATLTPVVPAKQVAAVVSYMNALGKDLSARRREKIETWRDGEVIIATLSSDQLFAPNDTLLRATAKTLLQPYANLLHQKGLYKLIVVTHTDDTGSSDYTDLLSAQRADAIYDYMVGGADSDDYELTCYALGATDPLLPNTSRSNRAQNRRVEIYIVPDRLMIEMARAQKLTYRNRSSQ